MKAFIVVLDVLAAAAIIARLRWLVQSIGWVGLKRELRRLVKS